jgi:peptide deformylase
MVLEIVKYGHPVLRQKGSRIDRITPEIKSVIEDMLETMYEAHGVGLAAQQVGLPLQLTVIDVSQATDRPSWMEREGRRVAVEDQMPLVLMNPEVRPVGGPVAGPEGCLSFPEIYADISRPESVDVEALTATGERIQFRCGGLLARAVQHETDHLHGILFIDRMDQATRTQLQGELEALQAETKAALKRAR